MGEEFGWFMKIIATMIQHIIDSTEWIKESNMNLRDTLTVLRNFISLDKSYLQQKN